MTETPATTQMVAALSPPDEHGRDASPGFNLREVFRAALDGRGCADRHRTPARRPHRRPHAPRRHRAAPAAGRRLRRRGAGPDAAPTHRPSPDHADVGRGRRRGPRRQVPCLPPEARGRGVGCRRGSPGQAGRARARLPFDLLEDLTPWGIATATQNHVDRWRRELEGHVVTGVPTPDGQHLVVDGSIRGHRRDGLMGVVKDVAATQYLADESVIPDRAGWRSPVFALPATTTAERDVVSAYLRLHPAPGSSSWSHGLIRVEAHDPAILDAACALAMTERQSSHSGDARWAVHLRGMRRTEEVLGAFRPYVFDF